MDHATLLVTGGCGFIGSHVVRRLVTRYADRYKIVNLDKLTYAGNPANLADVADRPNYEFVQGDITDLASMRELFARHRFQAVLHLAAESHVDRSIEGPSEFVLTNVVGTTNLLQCAREIWAGAFEGKRFYHVSTDEVYGSLGEDGMFTEETPYSPRSPYSASKAASDHLVRAFHHTYGLPVVISNCSNNYGPYQFPEKLIPTCICALLDGRPIPVYGAGQNVRDWLYVEDHAEAIDRIFHSGRLGETYNIGGDCEVRNLQLVEKLCDLYDRLVDRAPGSGREQIRFVQDRAGHDFRYAVDCSRLKSELGWSQATTLEAGLENTVRWYLENTTWLENIRSGAYRNALSAV